MRVRHIISERKLIDSETSWSTRDMAPKFAPIYSKTKPIRAGWTWRSAKCTTLTKAFTLVAECNPARDNWKALLIADTGNGHSVVGRFEYHGSHPGTHFHADCDRSGLETGSKSIDNLGRIPSAKAFHRRSAAWTEATFWDAAKKFFRVKERTGPLGI